MLLTGNGMTNRFIKLREDIPLLQVTLVSSAIISAPVVTMKLRVTGRIRVLHRSLSLKLHKRVIMILGPHTLKLTIR